METVYSINYAGNGVMQILKYPSLNRADAPHVFAQYTERKGRIVTEYVPGFGGLNFSKDVFENLIDGNNIVHYPDWSDDGYEAWLDAKASK